LDQPSRLTTELEVKKDQLGEVRKSAVSIRDRVEHAYQNNTHMIRSSEAVILLSNPSYHLLHVSEHA